MIILFSIFFLGLVHLHCRVAPSPWLAPVFALSSLGIVLYCFSLFNMLYGGFIAALILGAYGFASFLYATIIRRQAVPAENLGMFLLVTISLAFSYFFTRGMHYQSWSFDEISNWGFQIKMLMATKALPTNTSPLLLPAYFPIPGLLACFAGLFLGNAEQNSYFMHYLLLGCGILGPLAILSGQNRPIIEMIFKAVFLLALAAVFLVICAGFLLPTLLVESHLAVLMAAGSVTAVLLPPKRWPALLPICLLLTLYKNTGLINAGIIMLVYIAAQRRPEIPGREILAAAFLVGLICLSARYTWTAYAYWHELPYYLGKYFNYKLFLTEPAKAIRDLTINAWLIINGAPVGLKEAYWDIRLWIKNAPFWAFYLGITLVLVLIRRFPSQERSEKNYRGLIGAYIFGTLIFSVGYAVLVTVTPDFMFAPGTVHRYAGPPLFAFAVLAAALTASLAWRWFFYVLAAGVILLLVGGPHNSFGYPGLRPYFKKAYEQDPLRIAAREMVEKLDNAMPEAKSIFYIHQESMGLEKYVFAFEVAPRRTQDHLQYTYLWSFGPPYPKLAATFYGRDLWTQNLTLQEFSEIIANYDAVMIGQADAQFWEYYGTLFSDHDHTLYRIERNPDGRPKAVGIAAVAGD